MAIFFQLDEEHYRLYSLKQDPEPIHSTHGHAKGKNRLNKLKIFSVIELHMMLYEEEINGVEFPACSSDSKHKYLKTKEGESRCL